MRVALLLVAAVLLAGCSTGGGSASGGRTVRVTERDFRVAAPGTVRAGDVRLAVANRGPLAHELIVVKLGRSSLPLRGDGLTVDEDAVASRTVVAVEPQQAGHRTVVRAHLTPGRYELFCNMSGHYLGGMRAELEVR